MAAEEQFTFGALLSQHRLAAGLTQQVLAERAGLSARGISDLERGVKTHPRAYTVRHLADALTLAPGDRAIFERSALDPARRSRSDQTMQQAPAANLSAINESIEPERRRKDIELPLHPRLNIFSRHAGGQSAPISGEARDLLPGVVRHRRQPTVRIASCTVIVLLAIGTVAFALRPGSTNEARPYARLVASWTVPTPSSSTLVAPAAVMVGDGIVYVADSSADRINAFSTHGRLLFSWGTPGRGPGQLQAPQGLAPDGMGHVYVADTGNNRIDEFSSHGRFLRTFGTRGTRPGQFRSPEGVAVSTSTSWIYVADTGNRRVQAFTPAGVPVRGWDARGTEPGKMLRPTSLVVTGEGRVLVADGHAQQVQVLETDGSFLWYQLSMPPPESVAPSAVAQDAQDYQYTLDPGLDTVRKFDSYGHVLMTWHAGFQSARGLAVDAQGNVYVAETGNGRILKFAPGGTLSAAWNGTSGRPGATASPQALSLDAVGNLYVADPKGGQVVVLSPSGHILKRMKGGGKVGPLSMPDGVAIGPRGEVYVADAGNNRIVRFSRSGVIDATWAQGGDYPGPFSSPHGVRVDSRGHVFVADTLNNRIEELAPNGSYRQVWYVEVTPPGRHSHDYPPSFCSAAYGCGRWNGLAIDVRGFVYATDTVHDLVLKLSSRGETVARWGGTGTQPGKLRDPQGVAVSSTGTVYVADTGNGRVDVFNPAGKVIGIIRQGLQAPADVLVVEKRGTAATLYVADSGTGRIEQYVIAG